MNNDIYKNFYAPPDEATRDALLIYHTALDSPNVDESAKLTSKIAIIHAELEDKIYRVTEVPRTSYDTDPETIAAKKKIFRYLSSINDALKAFIDTTEGI